MIPTELQTYIDSCKAQGYNNAQIRQAVAGSGWSQQLIDEAIPAEQIRESLENISKPLEVSTNTVGVKSKGLKILLLILVAVLIASGIFAFIYYRSKNYKSDQKVVTTATPVALSKYSKSGVEFQYPNSWVKKGMIELVAEMSQASPQPEESSINGYDVGTLFMKKEKYDQLLALAKQEAAASPIADAGMSALGSMVGAAQYAELNISRLSNMDMKDVANSSASSVCNGDSYTFSTNNQPDTTRLSQTTINNLPAYVLTPEAACNAKSLIIFINTKTSSSTTPSPSSYVAEGVTILGPSPTPVPAYDVLQLSFQNVSSLSGLSVEQKALLDSLTIN